VTYRYEHPYELTSEQRAMVRTLRDHAVPGAEIETERTVCRYLNGEVEITYVQFTGYGITTMFYELARMMWEHDGLPEDDLKKSELARDIRLLEMDIAECRTYVDRPKFSVTPRKKAA
jgi:hypothetical protein